MSVLFIVLPLALLLAGVAVLAFLAAVRHGQFDDLDTPQHRAIFDDNSLCREPLKTNIELPPDQPG